MARKLSDYSDFLKRKLQTAAAPEQPGVPELRIVAYGRSTSIPLRSETLTVGSGLDCDVAVAGLPPGAAFRLSFALNGSASLVNGPSELSLFGPEPGTVPADGTLVLRDGLRWSLGEAEFQISLPQRSHAHAMVKARVLPVALLGKLAAVRVPLGIGAMVVGLMILVTASPAPQAAIPNAVSAVVEAAQPVTASQDGTLADLRKRLIEAGVASRVSVANTPGGLVYDIRGSEPERAHIETLIEEAREATTVPIVRRPSDLDPLRKKVAALVQKPEPRILMTDGRSYRIGESVHMDWKLEAVGAGAFVLSRGTERTTVDLREGGAS